MTPQAADPQRVTRREVLVAAAGTALLAGCGGRDPAPAPPRASATATAARTPAPARRREVRFADLERRFDARLGVFGIDTDTGATVDHRADERFAFCSTHKALSAGALLRRRSIAALRAAGVPIVPADLVDPSPVSAQHVGGSLSLLELAEAAVRFSDNTAANHLLAALGGPAGLQRELRRLGDRRTRCDRDEPELSAAVPGDPRDTSTARALATDLRAYVLGPALADHPRRVLAGWLRRNTTGDALIRAAVPDGWVVGDKTGSGGYGTRNDIAVLWPPHRKPIVLAVLSRRDAAGPDAERRDELIAAAAERALTAFA